MHQYLLDNAASNAAIDLKELEEEHANASKTRRHAPGFEGSTILLPRKVTGTIQLGNEQIQKMVKYQEQLHKIAEANRERDEPSYPLSNPLTKGWGAFGEAAIKGMEQASLSCST